MYRWPAFPFLFVVVLVSGCSDDAWIGPLPGSGSRDRYRISSVRTPFGLTGRSVIECPKGRCVLLHYQPCEMTATEAAEMEASVVRLLTGDPSTPEDDGERYCDGQHRWCGEANNELVQSTYNCCTFAVGDILGLTTSDWIMTSACCETENTFPMQVVFNSYFELVRHDRAPFDWRKLGADEDLQQNDVLCFVQSNHVNGVANTIIHAGRIWKHEGRNRVVSKIGTGPILVTPVETLAREYERQQFDVVEIYRLREQGR